MTGGTDSGADGELLSALGDVRGGKGVSRGGDEGEQKDEAVKLTLSADAAGEVTVDREMLISFKIEHTSHCNTRFLLS